MYILVYHPGKQPELFNYKDQGCELKLKITRSFCRSQLEVELEKSLG